MVHVCLYLHVHQPVRIGKFRVFDIGRGKSYFDRKTNRRYLERVIEKSYLPTNKILLNLIRSTNKKFKVSFSITGVLLEQLRDYPDVIESFGKIVDTGCSELVSETYYHSLAYLFSRSEFIAQVKKQEKMLKKMFNVRPKVFRNTELIYRNDIAKVVESLGYKAVLAEGWDKVLKGRSPCFVYRAKGSNVRLLLKHYRLSDDIAFRFSDRNWSEWPLTADKFSRWITNHNGNGEIINLFMDYETFGEHHWKESNIFEFLKYLPRHVLDNGDDFVTPSEAVDTVKPRGEVDFPFFVSWADTERDVSAWLGNRMQQAAARMLYSLEKDVLSVNDGILLEEWRKLQTSDHFYYMCTKWFADGDVHKYFNPYDSPYDAFINFANALEDLRFRLKVIKMLNSKAHADRRFLSNVPKGKEFYCRDGSVFRNLVELFKGIESMSDETFFYHVNEQKNDFTKWIREVVGDVALANAGEYIKDREKFANLVKKRVKMISML